jgi:hypothetical protein
VISVFRQGLNDIFSLVKCYAALMIITDVSDNLWVSFSKVKEFEDVTTIYAV